jgi:hypothetical protein
MSPAPIRRVRIRALFVISLCTVLVTIGSVWASRQQAGAPSRQRSSRFSTHAISRSGQRLDRTGSQHYHGKQHLGRGQR